MPVDRFESCKTLVKRAREHNAELARRVEGFFSENRSGILLFDEEDPVTRAAHFKVRFPAPIPSLLSAIAFDAVGALRAALDHAVFAATKMIDPGANERRIKFAFGDTPQDFERDISGQRCDSVPDEVKAVMRRLQPYRKEPGTSDGNILWLLNALANASKHRGLTPGTVQIGRRVFAVNHYSGRGMFRHTAIWDEEKCELTHMIMPPGATIDARADFTFFAVFSDIDQIKSVNAVDVIETIASVVSRSISEIETETNRVLLSRSP